MSATKVIIVELKKGADMKILNYNLGRYIFEIIGLLFKEKKN